MKKSVFRGRAGSCLAAPRFCWSWLALTGAVLSILVAGCSRPAPPPAAVAVAPTPVRVPKAAPTPEPTTYFPPVQIGPAPGATPVPESRKSVAVQPLPAPSLPTDISQVDLSRVSPEEKEAIRYILHMRECMRLALSALTAMKAATKLEPDKLKQADTAVDAYFAKALKAPSVPARCRTLNTYIVDFGSELRRAMTSLWRAQSGAPQSLDTAIVHINAAVNSMEQAATECERVAKLYEADEKR